MNLRISGIVPAAAALGLAVLAASPVARADTSNCTVISALPYTVATAGHYCLASNLVHAGTGVQAIRINASDVVLDCNGHTIEQTGTPSTAGIHFSGRSDVTIRGCTLRNFHRGLYVLGGAARSHRVQLTDNTVVGARLSGIHADLRNGFVGGNRVMETTGAVGMQLTVDAEGILVVEGNVVRGVTGAGANASGLSIGGSGRAIVRDNSISSVGTAGNAYAYGVRLITAASVTPVPAIVEGNQIYVPTGVNNIALSKSSTTAKSRCVDNSVVGTRNGTQWGASNACL